jgi:hypothetical protein
MARTTLDFEYGGKDYHLAYTIDVVKRLDRSGLLAEIANGQRPLTMTEDLFVSAFEANHQTVSSNIRRKIFEEFTETGEDGTLLECLMEMINDVRESMAPKGNVTWRMNRGDKI